MSDDRYSLDRILEQTRAFAFDNVDEGRVRRVYVYELAEYELRVPYDPVRLPGIQGVELYSLNRALCAYARARREIAAINDESQRGRG